jgi:hypothetical protein
MKSFFTPCRQLTGRQQWAEVFVGEERNVYSCVVVLKEVQGSSSSSSSSSSSVGPDG